MSNAATFPPHSPSNELGPIIYFPPFDEVGTDIILRSSDGVDFHVYRVVLSLASPFFKQMFSLPQPESATPVPVIPVAEASGILDLVLRLWYPGANPATFTGLEQLAQVIEITVAKYEIGFVTPTLQRHLVTYLETEPVAVFALGCQYGWKDIAEKAAKETLKRPLTSLFRPDLARYLKHVSADNYRALLVYHDACGMAVSSAGHLLPWRRPTWIWLQCRMCDPSMHKHTMPVTPRAWIFDYLDRTSALLKKIPGSNLSDIVLLNPTLKTAVACLACRPYAFTHLMEFVLEEYIPAVDAALNVVSLRLSF